MVSHVKNNDDNSISPALAFNKSRTRAIRTFGPHNLDVLSIIICGMSGDFLGNRIKA